MLCLILIVSVVVELPMLCYSNVGMFLFDVGAAFGILPTLLLLTYV